jgi:hypothetical protein
VVLCFIIIAIYGYTVSRAGKKAEIAA